MNMYGLIVPRRHLLVEFMLARIPIWRDVGVSRSKDDENLIAIFDLLPDGIGPSNMRKQVPTVAGIRIELKRKMISIKPIWSVSDKGSERVLRDDAVKFFDSRLFKVLGQVHSGYFAC